jgi:hypothetical protein
MVSLPFVSEDTVNNVTNKISQGKDAVTEKVESAANTVTEAFDAYGGIFKILIVGYFVMSLVMLGLYMFFSLLHTWRFGQYGSKVHLVMVVGLVMSMTTFLMQLIGNYMPFVGAAANAIMLFVPATLLLFWIHSMKSYIKLDHRHMLGVVGVGMLVGLIGISIVTTFWTLVYEKITNAVSKIELVHTGYIVTLCGEGILILVCIVLLACIRRGSDGVGVKIKQMIRLLLLFALLFAADINMVLFEPFASYGCTIAFQLLMIFPRFGNFTESPLSKEAY